jgi:ribosomal protein S18 acetylase RimI-like enzyme
LRLGRAPLVGVAAYPQAVRGFDEVRRGAERLRVGPWRGDHSVAYMAPATERPPSAAMVRHACSVLADRGYREILTAALSEPERAGFVAAGFETRDSLHLLAHDLRDIPADVPASLRRGRRGDRRAALEVDGRAFPTFWRLDEGGLHEALNATPSSRFRVAAVRRRVVGYAVTGRAGRRGYLQRLAVDPDAQGRGIGRALVVDSLGWMRRRGVASAVVNTQVANERALALYLAMGFRLQPSGLEVLGRTIDASQPAR